MQVQSFSSSGFLGYCDYRNSPEKIEEFKKECSGLSEQTELDLKSENYYEVFKALLCENDVTRRLNFLREHAEKELHGPLMYELAVTEFEANPTKQVYDFTAVPLLKAATFRAFQDAECGSCPSAKGVPSGIQYVYEVALTDLVNKIPEASKWSTDNSERITAIQKKVFEVAKKSMEVALPSPEWITNSSMDVFLGRDPTKLWIQWQPLRNRCAENFLDKRE